MPAWRLVVQTVRVNFVEWMHDPHSDVGYTAQAFELVPQIWTRRIALRQTVDMVQYHGVLRRSRAPARPRALTALTVGILKYSRDLAFTAATAYADAPRHEAPGTAGWRGQRGGRGGRGDTGIPSCRPGRPR